MNEAQQFVVVNLGTLAAVLVLILSPPIQKMIKKQNQAMGSLDKFLGENGVKF